MLVPAIPLDRPRPAPARTLASRHSIRHLALRALLLGIALWSGQLCAQSPDAPFDLETYRQRAATDRAAGIAEGRALLASGQLDDDPVTLRTMLWHMGGAAVGTPDDDALDEVVARLEQLATTSDDSIAESYAGFLRGARLIDLERQGEGLIEVLSAANRLTTHTDSRQRAIAATELCRAYSNSGRPEQALEHCRRHTQLIRDNGEPTALARAEYLEAIALTQSGHGDEAVSLLRSARQRFLAAGLTALAGRASSTLAGTLIDLNRFDEAIPVAREAVDTAQASGNPISLSIAQSVLAEALAGAGQVQDAVASIEASVAIMEGLDQPGMLSSLLHIHANILHAQGAPDEHVEALRTRSKALRGNTVSSQQADTISSLEDRYTQREQALRIRELEQENRSRQLALEAARTETHRQEQALRDQRKIVLLSIAGIVALAALLAMMVLLLRTQRTLAAHLKDQAYRDALTSLPNRRALLERLEALLQEPGARTANHALIMIDIDHFKAVNDRFGHPVGDAVLAGVGRCLLDFQPAEGLVGRLGGEEFLLLCPGIGQTAALALAERIRLAVRALPSPDSHDQTPVTISLGVAVFDDHPEQDLSSWMNRVDQALYTAKRGGRDRVESAP